MHGLRRGLAGYGASEGRAWWMTGAATASE
jgi:hypothetical protein